MSSSSLEEEEETFEHTLLVVHEVSVYKIPPHASSGGSSLTRFGQAVSVWFPMGPTARFALRNLPPANCLLPVSVIQARENNYEKYLRRGRGRENEEVGGEEGEENRIDINPMVNYQLKEGETIRINVKTTASGTGACTGMLFGMGHAKSKTTVGGSGSLLAPPPGGAGKLRSPLPPPSNNRDVAKISQKASRLVPPYENVGSTKQKDSSRDKNPNPFSDLSSIEKSLPSTTTSSAPKETSASGWAAF